MSFQQPGPPGQPGPQQPPYQAPYPAQQQPGWAPPPQQQPQQFHGAPPQQPYGYPPQQPQPPRPPAKKKRGGLITGVTALVVLVGGGGVYLATSGGEDSVSPSQEPLVEASTPGGPVWTLDEEVADGDRPEGMWVVGDHVVKAGADKLQAYSLADGSAGWSFQPEGVEAFCVPAQPTPDGQLVVGYGDHNCAQNLTLVDLNTGETGWTRPLEPQDEHRAISMEIAVAGETFSVFTSGAWSLHHIANGDPITSEVAVYDPLGDSINNIPYVSQHEVSNGQELCSTDAHAGGEKLIRRLSCATVVNAGSGQVSAEFYKLQELDPATGEPLWTMELPEGKWLDKIHSISPLLISMRSAEFERPTDLAVVEQGQITVQFPIENTGVPESDAHLLRDELCRDDIVAFDPVDDCGGMAVVGDVLYVSPNGRNNPVTAISLETGDPLWLHTQENVSRQLVLGADEEGVTVYQQGFEDGAVVRVSPDGQVVEPLFRTGDVWMTGAFFTEWHDGGFLSAPPDYSLEEDIAFYGPEGEAPLPADPDA